MCIPPSWKCKSIVGRISWRHNQGNIILYRKQFSGHLNDISYFLLLPILMLKHGLLFKLSTDNIFIYKGLLRRDINDLM
jgi:hypothetical protein